MILKNNDVETIPISKSLLDENPYLAPQVYMSTAAIVAEYFGLTMEQMMETNRHTAVRQARQIAMWLDHRWVKMRTGNAGWSVIARHFGKDHATVMHAVKTVENDMYYEDYLKMIFMVQVKVFGKIIFYKE